MNTSSDRRIYAMKFSSIYPLYIAKAEKKGRTKAEVDQIITWMTGYDPDAVATQAAGEATFEQFFAAAPRLNPARSLITGVICGVRLAEITDPLVREVRYLDKLIDELARGKKMETILRSQPAA